MILLLLTLRLFLLQGKIRFQPKIMYEVGDIFIIFFLSASGNF